MNGHKSNDNLVMMSQTARIAPHASRRAWALFLVFADGSKQQEKSLCLQGKDVIDLTIKLKPCFRPAL